MLRKWLVGGPLMCLLSACATEHEFRIDAAGDASADQQQEEVAIAPGTPLLVAAGNMLLGPTATLANPSPGSLALGAQSASVSGFLLSSGQTIVQLDSGTTVLVGGIGGTIGDVVTLDTLTGTITSGPGSLVGSTMQAASQTIVAPTLTLTDMIPTTLSGGSATGTVGGITLPPAPGPVASPVGAVLGSGCC